MKSLFGIYLEKDEVVQIAICVIAISFAFSLALARPEGLLGEPRQFFVFFVLSLVTVGSGFILHEMGHKLVAIHYGAPARFRMWVQGLVFMLLTSLFGVLFAAPGAVYIYSNKITKEENGIISIAGPLVNVALVFVFLGLAKFAPLPFHFAFIPYTLDAWHFGASMNLVLGLFNMIPAYPLDGSKVLAWKKSVWIVMTLFLLFFASSLLGFLYVILWGLMMLGFMALSKLAFG